MYLYKLAIQLESGVCRVIHVCQDVLSLLLIQIVLRLALDVLLLDLNLAVFDRFLYHSFKCVLLT